MHVCAWLILCSLALGCSEAESKPDAAQPQTPQPQSDAGDQPAFDAQSDAQSDPGCSAGASVLRYDFTGTPLNLSGGNNTVFVPIERLRGCRKLAVDEQSGEFAVTSDGELEVRAIYTRIRCQTSSIERISGLPASHGSAAVRALRLSTTSPPGSSEGSCVSYRSAGTWMEGATTSMPSVGADGEPATSLAIDAADVDMLAFARSGSDVQWLEIELGPSEP